MQDPGCSSTEAMQFDRLPLFILQQIGETMNLDDRLNFMATSMRVFQALKPLFKRFTHLQVRIALKTKLLFIQVCDESRETLLKIEQTGEEYPFNGHYLVQILQVCPNLEHVLIAVKPPLGPPGSENATNCPLFGKPPFTSSINHQRHL
jgi:hypothetical protein